MFIRSNSVALDPRVEKEVWSLATHGFKLTILAWDREGKFSKFESHDDKKIYRLRLRAPYGKPVIAAYYPLFWIWILLKLLRIRPKIVHSCDLDSVFPALLYRLLMRKAKVIFDVFDSYALLVRPTSKILSKMFMCLELLAASRSDAFVTVSNKQLAIFEAAKLKRIEIIMNVPLVMPRLKILEQGTKQKKFRIVYAGSISEDRGLVQLSEATKDIDDLELIIAGIVINRNTLVKIKQFSHIHYVGQLKYEQALQLQASADLILALYDPNVAINRIAMPNKVFEAMMLGVPIITNLTDIIKETKCGVVVNYYDTDAIKQAVLYVQEHPEIKLQLGLNGKRAFEQKFNWSHMERKLLKLYDDLISLT